MRHSSRAHVPANPVLAIVSALVLACSLGAASAAADPGKSENGASQQAQNGKNEDKAPATVAQPTATYVLRGRVVQVIRPSPSAIGSLSFRVLSSNRLGSQLRGMVVTVPLAAPVRAKRGTTLVVHLRAPIDVLSSGFGEATTIRVTPAA